MPALAFDMYGTLVDPTSVRRRLNGVVGDNAAQVADVWRSKQLEYTFRLTAMGRYLDFAEVTARSLDYALAAAGEEIGVYKPAPVAYRHLAERLHRPPNEVCLISSNPFDVLGATAVGMEAAWCNRTGGVFDTLGDPPEIIVDALDAFADALTR